MQRAGLRGVAFALLEDVIDVLTGVRLTRDGVFNGAGDFVGAVNVGKGHDLVDVAACVETASGELLVVMFGVRTQGVKGEQPLGVTGSAALIQEFFDVIGVFKVAMALVTAGM